VKRIEAREARLTNGQATVETPSIAEEIARVQREALVSNPLLDFDGLLVIRRKGQMGLPQNWQGNCSLPRGNYDNEIAVLSPLAPQGKLSTLFKPAAPEFVGDVDLNFDGEGLKGVPAGTVKSLRLYEMHYAYPYNGGDGRETPSAADKRVVRGGSWYDRPCRATASFRRGYRPCQAVFDTGFRVVCEDTTADRP